MQKPQTLPSGETPRLVRWFNSIGDFLQKLQAILGAAAGIGGVLTLGFLAFNSVLSPETRGDWFMPVSLFLIVIASFEGAYVFRIRKQRSALFSRLALSEDIIKSDLVKDMAWSALQSGCRIVDNTIGHMLSKKDTSNEEKLRRAVLVALYACLSNVLKSYEQQLKRAAFLSYDEKTGKFEVFENINLEEASYWDVRNQLSRDEGLVGRAIKSRGVEYVHNVDDSDEVERKGYKTIGFEVRHKTLAAKGIWVDNQPVGVLCVDYKEPNVFTQEDFLVISRFGDKIEVIYKVFPLL